MQGSDRCALAWLPQIVSSVTCRQCCAFSSDVSGEIEVRDRHVCAALAAAHARQYGALHMLIVSIQNER